jgi:hypothetical protein
MALPPPFVSGAVAALAGGGRLQTELTTRLASSSFKAAFSHMGIALVDLTTIGEDPEPGASSTVPFASNGLLDSEIAIGSLSKIAIMFAAFSLRERTTVGAAGVASSASDVEGTIAKLKADWGPIISKKIAKGPNDFPDFGRIFDMEAVVQGEHAHLSTAQAAARKPEDEHVSVPR